MFNQLFGKYLIESDIISEEQYEDILAKVEKTRAKLGLIAVSEGILRKKLNGLIYFRHKRMQDLVI